MFDLKLPINYFAEYRFNVSGLYTWSLIKNDKLIYKGIGKCPETFRYEKIDYTRGNKLFSITDENNDYFIFYEMSDYFQ